MFGDLKGLFAMLETFSKDMISASIVSAEADAKAAQASVTKLKAQKRAIERVMLSYRRDMEKSEKEAATRQKKWNKQMRAQHKRGAAQFGAPVMTVPGAYPPLPKQRAS